jgi:hypothetical protein
MGLAIKKLIGKLDIICASIGLILLLALIPVLMAKGFHHIYLVAVGIGIICVIVYLTLHNKLQPSDWFNIKSDWQVAFFLTLICLFGLYNIWYVNIQFPNSIIGLDPWTHSRVTTQEIDVALSSAPNDFGIVHLSPLLLGGYFSLMHIYLNSMIDLFGLSYKWTSLIFWGSLQTVGNIIFVYLVGKELLNKSVGLLAAFLVSCASCVVFFGQWDIPNGIGATLSLAIAYLFIVSYKSDKQWIAWLSLILLPVAFFTHILVAIWVGGTIICLSVGTLILDFADKRVIKA